MDGVRYVLALLLVVVLPAGMSMWFVIHPFASFWRRYNPAITYSVVLAVAAVVGGALYHSRETLMATEFGFSWLLTVIGVVCLTLSVVLERRYRQQIKVSTLFGLPEVSATRQSELLTEGIYSEIRHPRYLGLVLEISAFALFANYLAAYMVVVAIIPVLGVTVLLEERELLQRFGEEYVQYAQKVPRFIPRSWRERGRGDLS